MDCDVLVVSLHHIEYYSSVDNDFREERGRAGAGSGGGRSGLTGRGGGGVDISRGRAGAGADGDLTGRGATGTPRGGAGAQLAPAGGGGGQSSTRCPTLMGILFKIFFLGLKDQDLLENTLEESSGSRKQACEYCCVS